MMTTGQLRRVRWGVRFVLSLGVAASVTANILHAERNPVSQVIAAWPPLALLLTIELISRIPVTSRGLAAARLVATTGIAGIAAWVSYWHMAGVASRYGETGATPYLLPLSVDGLVIVASVSLVELAGEIRERSEKRSEPAHIIDAAQEPSAAPTDTSPHPPPPAPELPSVVTPAPPIEPEPTNETPAPLRLVSTTAAGPSPQTRRPSGATVMPPPNKRRDVACALVREGKTCTEIHEMWGRPETPKIGTIRWWTRDLRNANEPAGEPPRVNGEPVGADVTGGAPDGA
jgi:hypothetical protein